jgi:Flp pilus assembly pilin Flp
LSDVRSNDDARRVSRASSDSLVFGQPAGPIARLDAEVTVKSLIARIRTWRRDDAGQDLLEYALLVALIALVAYAAIETSGQQINTLFMSAASMMQNAAQAAGA